MLDWIRSNAGTIIVTMILALAVVLIIIKMVKDKKQGRTSCGHNCAHCTMAGACHKK